MISMIQPKEIVISGAHTAVLGTISILGEKDKKIQILLEEFDELFKDPMRIPPKKSTQHEIRLMLDATLPNIGLHRKSMIEREEVKRKIYELLN